MIFKENHMRNFLLSGLVLTASFGTAKAECHVPPECENCAVHLVDGQDFSYKGAELYTQIGTPSGSDLSYSGAARAEFILFGPYQNQRGKEVRVSPVITLSANWNPGYYETCRKRDFRSKCVGWDSHPNDSGFTIDYAIEGGTVIWSKDYKSWIQNNHATIGLPTVYCDGDLEKFEVRIHNAYGGTVDFTVHDLKLHVSWTPQ